MWTVKRHSGRNGTDWRILFSGSKDKAERRYKSESERMRQGGVLMEDADGHVVSQCYAPRLRTRW